MRNVLATNFLISRRGLLFALPTHVSPVSEPPNLRGHITANLHVHPPDWHNGLTSILLTVLAACLCFLQDGDDDDKDGGDGFLITKRRCDPEPQEVESDEEAVAAPRKRRRKLKIRTGSGTGTRTVFGDDGMPADPLAVLLENVRHWCVFNLTCPSCLQRRLRGSPNSHYLTDLELAQSLCRSSPQI